MNKDIRISVNMTNHPKVKRLMRVLGADAFYSLISLWSYAAINKPNGDLTGLDEIDISIAANWDGDEGKFFNTICQLGFIDCTDEKILIHDWVEHNPYAVGADNRSDKSRFNKMKSHYPELHKKLQSRGMSRISASEYQQEVKQYLSTAQEKQKESTSPSPSPSPTPIPSPKKSTGKRFSPPSLNEVAEYCNERKNNVDPSSWVDHYTANGWMVGKNKMKDWKAAVRTWEKNNINKPTLVKQSPAISKRSSDALDLLSRLK